LDIVADNYKKLVWIEHTVIIDHGRVVKQTFEYKPECRKKTVKTETQMVRCSKGFSGDEVE
jgi:hypothetical protein